MKVLKVLFEITISTNLPLEDYFNEYRKNELAKNPVTIEQDLGGNIVLIAKDGATYTRILENEMTETWVYEGPNDTFLEHDFLPPEFTDEIVVTLL